MTCAVARCWSIQTILTLVTHVIVPMDFIAYPSGRLCASWGHQVLTVGVLVVLAGFSPAFAAAAHGDTKRHTHVSVTVAVSFNALQVVLGACVYPGLCLHVLSCLVLCVFFSVKLP